jgi:hypothetical protein
VLAALDTEVEMGASSRNKQRAAWPWLAAAILIIYAVSHYPSSAVSNDFGTAPAHAESILAHCATLHDTPVAPTERRLSSDRFVDGTRPYLIRVSKLLFLHVCSSLNTPKNATIWTGEDSGRDVVRGDVLVDKGLIQAIGRVPNSLVDGRRDLEVLEANGAWLTPGLVDILSYDFQILILS